MGQVYILKKEHFKYNKDFRNVLTLKEILTLEEAKDFVQLQKIFSSEITEPINILTEDALVEKKPLRAKGLIFCLAMEGSRCIGYGYGYVHDDKETFYLDTIGVAPECRGKKIGTEIKVKLISYAFDKLELKSVKAVTQSHNKSTIHINEKIGFKPLPKTLKRELEVAFSKHSQPIWFRIIKYVLLISALYFFWGSIWLWIGLSIFFVFVLCLHFWYRYKTEGWTKSYKMWKHH